MEVKNIKVSILVPIYGVEKYIERCVRSLFEQSFTDIEYIFVNDCTKDSSMVILNKLIKEYEEKTGSIKIINHEKNGGLAASRITALKNATGEFITFVDSDDYLPIHAIGILIKSAIEENSDIVIGNFFNDARDIQPEKVFRELPEDKIDDICKSLSIEKHVALWGKLYRSTLFRQQGFSYFEEGLDDGEDYVATPRLLYNSEKTTYIPDFVYYYNTANINSYSAQKKIKAVSDMKKAFEIQTEFFKDKPDSICYLDAIMRGKLHVLKYYPLMRKNERKICCTLFLEIDKYVYFSFFSRLQINLIRNNQYLLYKVVNKIASFLNS